MPASKLTESARSKTLRHSASCQKQKLDLHLDDYVDGVAYRPAFQNSVINRAGRFSERAFVLMGRKRERDHFGKIECLRAFRHD